MNRRLGIFMLTGVLLLSILPACSDEGAGYPLNITILHTNNVRSHLDNIALRSTLINQIRAKERASNVLLFDAGDAISGSPYFTIYHGQADFWFMKYLHYDAITLGNHEFDNGTSLLTELVNQADFPVVSANIDFSKEKVMGKRVLPWVIIEKGGVRFGVFGLITEKTSEISMPGNTISFTNYINAAKKAVAELEGQQVNKIIALTHLGWDSDIELAKLVTGIDIIIGGHSGTIPQNYPTVVHAVYQSSSTTLVVQSGKYGGYLGCLDVSFDQKGVVQMRDSSRLIPIDNGLAEDKSAAEQLATYRKPLDEMKKTVIGETRVDLKADEGILRTQETLMGNLVADAMLAYGSRVGANVALWNAGSIRDGIPAGSITLNQLLAVLPFNNRLVVADLTGEQLQAALENGLSQIDGAKGRFPLVAGIRLTYDHKAPLGNQLLQIDVRSAMEYTPLFPKTIYRVVTNNFIAQGNYDYSMFRNAPQMVIADFADYQALAEYINSQTTLEPHLDGRITILQP